MLSPTLISGFSKVFVFGGKIATTSKAVNRTRTDSCGALSISDLYLAVWHLQIKDKDTDKDKDILIRMG